MLRRLRDRSTGDLLVMMIAGTVCFVLIGTTLTILVVEIATKGNQDTATAAAGIGDVINTMIGLLAGFLAGRSDTALTVSKTEARVRGEQQQQKQQDEVQ
jgi:hypothetical protein